MQISLILVVEKESLRLVGVDIMPDPERCLPIAKSELGLSSLLANLEQHRVKPGYLHNSNDRFDIIYSWSVFEHVDPRVIDEVIELLHKSLKPDGVMFIQIAPFYYSAEGSHLYDFIKEPWGHQIHPSNVYYDKLMTAENIDNDELREALLSTYITLSRITASELERRFKNKNFTNQVVLLLKKKATAAS